MMLGLNLPRGHQFLSDREAASSGWEMKQNCMAYASLALLEKPRK